MWLGIAMAVGLVVWAVGGLIALNPLPWHVRKHWDSPGEKELRIIQAIALLLIVAGVTVFFVTEPGTFWHDLWPNMVSTCGVILGIDELNRRRSAQEYKRDIIRQMASRSNDFALDAARIAKDEGWLEDGSLAKYSFKSANLAGADLWRANFTEGFLWEANLTGSQLSNASLARALLMRANFTGAHLLFADFTNAQLNQATFTGASLWGACFVGADLSSANFTETNPREANFREALYSNNTQWPDDFDPKSKGAINWDELSEEGREKWWKWYRPEQPY